SHFAAHLATLNLAARRLEDEENYPCIARRNFFDVPRTPDAFCELPGGPCDPQGRRRRLPVPLPKLDAIVGNPPYIRQEKIPKLATVKREPGEPKAAYEARCRETKEYLLDTCRSYWPGVKLSGRSDLHCYFWPVAAGLLQDNGWFGFLTSSSWLDVEYGFDLQRWILENFKLVAVMESLDEPWFSDARVKTAVTILQRCPDQAARNANTVRFVRLLKPLRDILGLEKTNDEGARQQASERLRDLILKTGQVVANDHVRIVPVPQRQLWEEGVRAAALLRRQPAAAAEEDDADETTGLADSASTDYGAAAELAPVLELGEAAAAFQAMQASPYAAGKWGRFLRAPDIYFRLLERCAGRFVRLGEITEVRFGIKSGCDDFFMPHDVTARTLEQAPNDLAWNEVGLITPCKRRAVAKGKLRIIEAGDGTLHPVEAEYLRPEVHSLMQVDRPVVRAADTDRVVLWVDQPLDELGPCFAAKYLRWGAKQTFASKKSKPVPLPQRATCAARKLWYDITSDRIGVAFWPKIQQYRHIIPVNPDGLDCNCNLYTMIPELADPRAKSALGAVLNSTVVALMKCFFGRYAGTEAALKTEVVDVNLLEIPDPRGISPELAGRLAAALERMSARKITGLVEERLMLCRDPEQMREILKNAPELPTELRQDDRHDLDDAVLELLGVATAKERKKLLAELYAETTLYFRRQRVMEIQGMCNRAKAGRRGLEPADLAATLWDALRAVKEDLEPVVGWLGRNFSARQTMHIPEGHATALGADDLFGANAVVFKTTAGSRQLECANPEQAALVAQLAACGVRGDIRLPADPRACTLATTALEQRLARFRERFTELAASRAGDQALREKIIQTMVQWLIHGRE
ncbi:MAG: Eco57I restriction-modification methylase domain-containing protein, partial [bacterium]